MFTGMPTHFGQEFPRTAAEVTALLGLTPSNLYLCQESASPLVDVIAATNLTGSGTPLYQQTVAFPRYGAAVDAGELDLWQSAADALADDGITSHAWLVMVYVGAAHAAARRMLHNPGAKYYLGEIALATGLPTAVIWDGTASSSNAITVDHSGLYFPYLWVLDRAAATLRQRTHLGSASSSTASIGACSSAGATFQLGSGAGADMKWLWAARMSGANAESLDDAQIIKDFWIGP